MKYKITFLILSTILHFASFIAFADTASSQVEEQIKEHCIFHGKAIAGEGAVTKRATVFEKGVFSWLLKSIANMTLDIDNSYSCSFVFVNPEYSKTQESEILIHNITLTQNLDLAESLDGSVYKLVLSDSASKLQYVVVEKGSIYHMGFTFY